MRTRTELRSDVPNDGPDDSTTDSVIERIVTGVRDAIAKGTLSPGQRLTEREVIHSTGAARTSVREALSRLRALGLLERGARGRLQVPPLNATAIDHIYDVRLAIESMAAELFTIRATEEEIAELVEVSDPAEDRQRLRTQISATYRTIMQGARNPLLLRILTLTENVRGLCGSCRRRCPAVYSAICLETFELTDAVQRRNPEDAARATRAQVAAARKSVGP